ncbi:peptidylprolyl isomerase [Muriicola sp. E247]|jgi:peptidylprolyl isomerase|uniref:FKBP-type peptidyl-prolyl cis-trans isomerase n=1 Tax=Muriicola sp. E247 TaxID=3242730 RepID=UPI00179DBA31|nr:peptidylprolyl isomerase [Muriicola sp.]MBT8290913.1 peptidylprolyl isomerase [Muriicola sp.]NNC61944.1 peptidylprolyl isomerase [Eudoraea sp.]NNK36112.1 peptidylprolyl isomerase [Eudoraea sp.]NNL38990.1 peptidylprolyl isomerase [Flavobacteriaceae bacterium]
MGKVKANDTIRVHYTGKLNDGQVFDSSLERDPLEVTLGQGALIPGFEKGLIDMEVDEEKTITIPKEEAYGEVRKELFQKVSKSDLPEEIKPEIGMGLVATNPDGSEQQLRVVEVEEEHIVIDANHPLAGQDLIFDLTLVEIK